MNVQEKLELIKRNTQEIITEEELKNLFETKKQPVIYLGTAITSTPHIGYFVWVKKMCDFMKAGCKVIVLLADIHGALDNCPWELLEKRYDYYKIVIPALFESLGADLKKLELVKGSDYQLSKEYVFDVLRMSTMVSVADCTKAASEVVKMGESPKLSGLLYPIFQALDEEYLKADMQFGGNDQRKIFVFDRENLPKLGYKARVEVLSPLVPGLTASGKMSSSEAGSKVDLLDDEPTVNKKIGDAFCEPGKIEKNGVLAFVKYVVIPHKEDNDLSFVVERPEKFGGDLAYKSYVELERDYVAEKLHPQDLKKAVAKEVNVLLGTIRKRVKGHEKLIMEAYPDR
ncbi:tyrosine--tRNA ligase [Candidatus Woesearchaeota archaeon CG10_big_fil_rev_8_21_14_0_10_37_12]|nr:MAG: tyrosine--tRNA ligase [Candidatus Woesearchaeota archaeon CG10_big_fil_rev_8_21_14_0_10_37_12]